MTLPDPPQLPGYMCYVTVTDTHLKDAGIWLGVEASDVHLTGRSASGCHIVKGLAPRKTAPSQRRLDAEALYAVLPSQSTMHALWRPGRPRAVLRRDMLLFGRMRRALGRRPRDE